LGGMKDQRPPVPTAAGRSGVLTVGVEEEFLLVDQHGRLAATGPEVSSAVAGVIGQVEHELRRCQVESATEICVDVDQISTGLTGLRDQLAGAAAARGLRLLPTGTAPLLDKRAPRFTPDVRYHHIVHEFGALAESSLTCACHVHIGIPDRSSGLTISNHLRPWLPLLLALTANSPFHNGADTRYASWRHELWQRWPSAGPPPHYDSVDDYESRLAGLAATGAIVDRGMVYWDIRLSEHQPTVEIRVADVAGTVEEATLLAVLIRALAAQALDRDTRTATGRYAGPRQEVLRGRIWRAARDGLAGRCVDPRAGDLVPAWQLLDSLVDTVRPWLRSTGDDEFADRTLAWLREAGCGAERQRAAFARRQLLTDVVDDLAWPVRSTDRRRPAG
jgi:glutamate---cysteine ligase / carboxylate-amine ligase